MVKVQQFLDWINAFAPFDSAEGFDNVGLLMGDLLMGVVDPRIKFAKKEGAR